MKKRVLPIAVFTTVLLSGCGSTDGNSTLMEAFNSFTNILDRSLPFVEESQAWEQYAIDKTTQGVTYGTASTADSQFVSRKMDAEFGDAVDRLERPFAVNESIQKELDEAGRDYQFTYHHIMPVKDKRSSATIGYCVNFDAIRFENGKLTPVDTKGNLQKYFIYVAKDKPVSVTTAGDDFIKTMCGVSFYNKYKNPNA